MDIEIADNQNIYKGNIKIFGVGGAGGNILSHIISNSNNDFDSLVINTDSSDLEKNELADILHIGVETTGGLGAGSDPKIGFESAKESEQLISDSLNNTDILFILAGMGGGTGTGAAPHIVDIARKMKILTVGIVTMPFNSEGKQRMDNARDGLLKLKESVDVLIVLPNQKILEEYNHLPIFEALHNANDIFLDVIDCVCQTMNVNGHINVDFADIRKVIRNKGYAIICSGSGTGKNKVEDACELIFKNIIATQLEFDHCDSMIINVIGGKDLLLAEFEKATEIIIDKMNSNVDVIKGLVYDDEMSDKIKIILIATGLKMSNEIVKSEIGEIIKKNIIKKSKREEKPEDYSEIIRRIKNIQNTNNSLPSFLSNKKEEK